MTHTALMVRNFLQKNPHIIKSLHEGVINIRGLSIHIIQKMKLDSSTDAVISSIRRYQDEHNHSKESKDIITDILRNSRISTKSRLVMIGVERHFEILSNVIPQILKVISVTKGEVLRIIEGRASILFICDYIKKKELLSIIPKSEVVVIKDFVAEINIQFSEKYGDVPGLIAPLITELASNEINIIQIAGGMPEFLIFVDEKDISKTHDVIFKLLYTK